MEASALGGHRGGIQRDNFMMQETAVTADLLPLLRRQVVEELTLERARDLLDWLEGAGVDQFNVEIEQSGQFRVVWTERLYPK
jgi:hypothetical protein